MSKEKIESRRKEGKICKCGCEKIIPFFKYHRYQMPDYIQGHGRKNRHNSIEHNQIISLANKGRHYIRTKPKKYKEINCPFCNISFYPEHSKKYCSRDCYAKAITGRKLSPDSIEKSRLSRIGHIVKAETKRKISLANSGEGNGRWKEITIGKIKHAIRKRDNFICLICGLHQEKSPKSLDVHHIDYDDTNNIPQNLITLCHPCHAKTNKTKRIFWEEHCHSILNDKYNYEYTHPIIFEIINETKLGL